MPVCIFPSESDVFPVAFPASKYAEFSTNFASLVVHGIPGAGADAGRYTFVLPDDEDFWILFRGGAEPASFAESLGVFVARVLTDSVQLVYFTHIDGENLRAMPATAPMSDFASSSIPCEEVDSGLYRVVLSRSVSLQYYVYRDEFTPIWGSHVGAIGLPPTVSIHPPIPPAGGGFIVHLLSVDYEDDWEYLEGIEDIGLEFGPNRHVPAGMTAPTAGVKAKRASHSDSDIMMASASYGYDVTDTVFVVWASTVLDITKTPPMAIDIRAGDILTAFDHRWIVKSVRRNQDFAQFRCVCRRSTIEEPNDYTARV